jgi:hypothetical protein
VAVFDQNELNKLGIILLDYLKLEKDFDLLNSKHEKSLIINKEEVDKLSNEKITLLAE